MLALVACTGPHRDDLDSANTAHSPSHAADGAIGVQADCPVDFADQDGWYGGDAAASIVLPGNSGHRSLWLFGDSFVSSPEGDGRDFPFVHNTIAVSHCRPGRPLEFDFVWRDTPAPGVDRASGDPSSARAFFEPDPTSAWMTRLRRESGTTAYYWPLSGAVVRGSVYVALLRVAPAAAKGPFGLPFRMLGVDLARIENPSDVPQHWRIRLAELSSRPEVLPSTALVATSEYLYTFATLERGDGRAPRILNRVAVDALASFPASLAPQVETLARDGRWRQNLDPAEARILMSDDASEMSVHFDPVVGRWLAIYSDATPEAKAERRADAIWLRRAERLEGPWSEPEVFARIPELEAATDPLPGEPFCYAAKAHPELARSGRLLVTYVCNLFAADPSEVPAVLERLRTTSSLYRPRAILRRVPAR